MSLVFGIGKGLFSIGLIWIIGLVLCILLVRLGKQGSVFGIVLLLVILSIIMVAYPREGKSVSPKVIDDEDVDKFYLPRVLYACLICLFVLVGVVAFLLDHVLMPNLAKAAKTKKTYAF